MSLRNTFKNIRRGCPTDRKRGPCPQQTSEAQPPSKRLKVHIEDDVECTGEEYKEAVTAMKLELKWSQKCRNHALLKELMEKTRSRRQRWIVEECPYVSMVVNEFPWIATSKCVCQ